MKRVIITIMSLSFGSYRMKSNGKLSQRCWQEVLGCSSTKARLKSRKKHCVLDDTMGMQKLSSCA